MKHFLEEYYIELNLIKKPEVVEDDELSDDEISDKFVPVEGGEVTKIVEVSKSIDDNKTTVVEADEWNDDWMNATVVDEWTNGNEKQWEQSGNSVIIIDD